MARTGLFASYSSFLMFLGAGVILLPMLSGGTLLGRLVELTVVASIVTAALQLAPARPIAVLIVASAAVHEVGAWASAASTSPAWVVLDLSSGLVLILLVAGIITTNVWRLSEVSFDSIVGGLAVYVLLAVAWGVAYQLLEFAIPGSFATSQDGPGWGPWETAPGRFPRLFLFSFVTLTTLGYGDLVPANLPAGALAALEAVVGPVYLTVLIARLVALEVATARKRDVPARDDPDGDGS